MIKICFIWIKRFRNFENLGINLSSSEKFSFCTETSQISKIQLNPLPLDFFGSTITDVTGIIGKNGAGKSNAVEMICKILKGPKTALQSDFFYITKENDKYNCYTAFNDERKLIADFEIEFNERQSGVNDVKIVFFSNVFDERRYDFDKEIGDISANYRHLRSRFIPPSSKNVSEFEKQIRLINSDLITSLNIDLPKQILITSRVWDERFSQHQRETLFGEFVEDYKHIKTSIRETSREMPPDIRFVHIITFGFFLNFLHRCVPPRLGRYGSARESESPIWEKFSLLAEAIRRNRDYIPELLIGFIEEAAELIDEHQVLEIRGNSTRRIPGLEIINSSKLQKQLTYLRDLKKRFSNVVPEYRSEGIRRSIEYFAIDFQTKNDYRINQFFTLFEENTYIDINWIGISSGHKAYLNLFASLYHELRQSKLNNLLLCIDEGDLTFILNGRLNFLISC